MLERQREGVAKAKAAGKYEGRKSVALDGRQEVVRLAAEGLAKAAIARRLKLGPGHGLSHLGGRSQTGRQALNALSVPLIPKPLIRWCSLGAQLTETAAQFCEHNRIGLTLSTPNR